MMALLTKNQQEIRANLLMKIFMGLLTQNQQEIGSYLLIKIFIALLTKNQEIGSFFTNKDIYGSVDKKINEK